MAKENQNVGAFLPLLSLGRKPQVFELHLIPICAEEGTRAHFGDQRRARDGLERGLKAGVAARLLMWGEWREGKEGGQEDLRERS